MWRLADQDDVWLPHKLEASLALLQQVERRHGIEQPLLGAFNLELIDADGARTGMHLSAASASGSLRTSPEHLAFTNVVTGCTVLLKSRTPEPGFADSF